MSATAQSESTQGHEFFQTVAELTSHYIIAFKVVETNEYEVCWSNGGFEELTGLNPSELRTRADWAARLSPGSVDNIRQDMGPVWLGHAITSEVKFLDRDGRWRDLRVHIKGTRSSGSKVDGFVVAGQDVTHERRLERMQRFRVEVVSTLAQSLDYQTTLSNLARLAVPDWAAWCAVDLLDDAGGIQRVSVAHEDPEKARWARAIADKYPTDMNAPAGLANVIRTGKAECYPFIDEDLLKRAARDEEHLKIIQEANIRSAMIAPIKSRDKVLGVITFVSGTPYFYSDVEVELAEDIGRNAGIAVDNARLYTDLARSESEVRRLNSELEKRVQDRTVELQALVNEMEAFTYTIAHDMRAPLRSIVGNSHIILDDLGDMVGEEGRENLVRISASAKKLADFVDDLLRFVRVGRVALNRESVDLTALVEEIIAELPPVFRTAGEWHVEQDMRTFADPTLLRMAIQNLLDNAAKYRDCNRPLAVTVGSESGAYFVRDTGIGFNPAYMDKVFQPFERLHRDVEFAGTGIGLANTKRIIERHGGRIWAESEPGVGSTFFFTIAD